MVIYLNLCIILHYSGKKMIKAAILGATGYAGSELVRILSAHKEAELVWLASHSHAGESFSTVHPAFRGICDQVLEDDDIPSLSFFLFLSPEDPCYYVTGVLLHGSGCAAL